MPAKPSSEDSARSRYRAPALEKGLDILELLASRSDGLGQSEIARALGRSVGEIFRMLSCLVDRGYVAILRPQDRYVLTLKLFELAHRYAPTQRMLADALPLMRELATRVHQSCHLTVIESGHGVVVAQVDGPGHIGFAVRAGSVMPLTSTASGRVLLAFQAPEERAIILARDAAAASAGATSSSAPSTREIDAIRQRGYEEMDSTRTRGVHDVSFPVLDHAGHAVAAMTVPCIERLDVPELSSLQAVRAALSEATARLSIAIGGRPPGTAAAKAARTLV
ncbi:MAG: IclR family transcriptional regulator [Planctomycetes bacterium]|nr:IclR family transcriptional regulator [Planctomycetota bacterium]